MQERDMVVTGGLTWWEDFICVACYNLQESRDEIRLYPRRTVDFIHIFFIFILSKLNSIIIRFIV